MEQAMIKKAAYKRVISLICAAGLATLLLGSASTAHAQSSRVYVAGYMGLNLPSERDFTESIAGTTGSIQNNNVFAFAGALGLRLNRNWRLEGELSYRKNNIDQVKFRGGGNQKINGDMRTALFMTNLYYDFNLGWQDLFPFVTAGVGLAWHNVDIRDGAGMLREVDENAIGFAYQVGSGVKYRIAEDMALTGAYHYIGTSDLDVGSYNFNYRSHEFRIGVQYDLPVNWLGR